MKKNGFALVETIITIVVLSTSLIYLYGSFTNVITREEDRLYYDDIANIYKVHYLKSFLEDYSKINSLKNSSIFNSEYYITIGYGTGGLFDKSEDGSNFDVLLRTFNVSNVLLIKTSVFSDCLQYDKNISTNNACKAFDTTVDYTFLSRSMRNYINTLSNNDYDYMLVVEFASKKEVDGDTIKEDICHIELDPKCTATYASIGM